MTKSNNRHKKSQTKAKQPEDALPTPPAKASIEAAEAAQKIEIPGDGEKTETKKAAAVGHIHYANTSNLVKVRIYGERSKGRYPYHTFWCPDCDAASIKKELLKVLEQDATIFNKLCRTYLRQVGGVRRKYDVTQDLDVKILMNLIPYKVKYGGKIYLRIASSSSLWVFFAHFVFMAAVHFLLYYNSTEQDRSNFTSIFIGVVLARFFVAPFEAQFFPEMY